MFAILILQTVDFDWAFWEHYLVTPLETLLVFHDYGTKTVLYLTRLAWRIAVPHKVGSGH